MPIAKLDDISIYYELHGEGIPLVLIAGYTCDHNFWVPMVEELSKYHQVLLLDNRACGQTTDSGKPFTIETMANDTIALFQKLNLTHPTIVGHSMGGAIALTIAHQFPHDIDKLIVMNTAPKFSKRTTTVVEGLLNLRKDNASLERQVEIGLPWFYSGDFVSQVENIKTYVEVLNDNPYPQSVSDQERQLRALVSFDSRQWLNEIKVPTLIVAAKDDISTLVSESEQLAEKIPNSELITIPGCHAIEQPEIRNEIILSYTQV